ncbi:hypothetical protein CPC08DRAFT_756618 [Agrocybe pediades]|nr:hypothetical protein CPC08DRAFT_756618 [Agrocybe pediades]
MHTRHTPSILPGAWSEHRRDSNDFADTDEITVFSAPEPISADESLENPLPAIADATSTRRTNVRHSACENRLSSSCSDYEDDSNISDDYYSFVSEGSEDADAVSLALQDGPKPATGKGKERLKDDESVRLSEAIPPSSALSSSSHEHHPEHVTFSNDVPSKLSARQAAHLPIELEQRVLEAESSSLKSSMVSRILDYAQEASASSRTSIISDDSSGRPLRFKKLISDDDSVYSNYSGLDYARVCDMITHLGSGSGNSNISVNHTPRNPAVRAQSSSRPSRQSSRRYIGPGDTSADTANQPSILNFYPDENNPWTLSLDATLTATESNASQTSDGSLSIHSSRRRFPHRQDHSSYFFPRSHSSVRQSLPSHQNCYPVASSATTSHSFDHPEDPLYALPRRQAVSTNDTQLREDEHVAQTNVANRNVLQKTKALCSKLKKLIVTRKPRTQVAEPNVSQSSMSRNFNTSAELPPSLPYLHSPSTPTSATPSWSLDKLRPANRSRKVSTPAEHTGKIKPPSIENKNTYEYHARPKTLSEIKSKRRFSLPAFKASASQNNVGLANA